MIFYSDAESRRISSANARARCEREFFSSALISAKVRVPPKPGALQRQPIGVPPS